MRIRKTRLYLISIISLIFFSACTTTTSFENATFKTLNMAATTYEGTMETLGDAYKKGLISEKTKNNVIVKANIYWKSYHTAVILYEIYMRQENSDNKNKLLDAVEVMNMALIELLKFSQSGIN